MRRCIPQDEDQKGAGNDMGDKDGDKSRPEQGTNMLGLDIGVGNSVLRTLVSIFSRAPGVGA
jgi:hypothetical protein